MTQIFLEGESLTLVLNNEQCQARPTLVNIISDETIFYPFTVSANKSDGSCSTIDDPYA